MGFWKKLSDIVLPPVDPEVAEYKAELKKQFTKDSLKAQYEVKLKNIKKGKKSGFAEFGDSLMKASDKMNNYDFQGNTGKSKGKSKEHDFFG